MTLNYSYKNEEWITDDYIIRGDAIDGYRVYTNDCEQEQVYYNLYFESVLHWVLGLFKESRYKRLRGC